MDESINELVQKSATFVSLDTDAREQLLPKLSRVDLKAKDILFYQGDNSDSVYLLMSGKLSTQLTTSTSVIRNIGYIEAGETVGELGALTNEPRSLSVIAVKDSVLLKLSAKDFIDICHQYPKVMFSILRPMISRTSSLIQLLAKEKNHKHIVLLPANNAISIETFSEKLQEFAKRYPNLVIISDYTSEFHDKNMSVTSAREIILKLSGTKKSSKRLLYVLSSFDTPLARVAFKQANMIYITAPHDSKPKIDTHILDKIKSKGTGLLSGPNLILLHTDDKAKPNNTITWLKLTEFTLHHHVRLDNKQDFMRVLRFIRGRAVGVVLSGGGTRGWAHIGAIKALRKSKIPIDFIGGSSVGALVAGCYASTQSFDMTYKLFNQIVIDSAYSISWRSLTWPIISLFNAKNYTRSQINAFGDLQIEDLWMPYFCITSNLASNTEDIQMRGTLWEKIRASTAIPGLIPPMLINNELHIDGGIINNLPVDVMRKFVGTKGRVIAIELNTFSPDKEKYDFPPILTFWEALGVKLGLKKSSYKFPKFIDTFMRGIFIGSELRSKQNAVSANTLISFNLNEFSMLHSNPKEGLRLVEVGFNEALKQLSVLGDVESSS